MLTAEDCDDSDPLTVNDMDCDGVLSTDDCDDTDSSKPTNDMDCDGILTADDCDDADPNTVNDMDCDGTLSVDDCDDNDSVLNSNDSDADGYSTCDGDCDDSDPTLSPGATEVCDGVDNDCDPNTLEDGMVIFFDGSGVATDLTSVFATGTSTLPTTYTLTEDYSELNFCNGTYYVELLVDGYSDIRGLGNNVVLAGGGGSPVITSTTSLSVYDLTIQDGDGGMDPNNFLVGGGIACKESYTGYGNPVLNINNVTFQNNSADIGGAIGVYTDSYCDVNVNDSLIQNNTATYGGGIGLLHGDLEITSSDIVGNSATYGGGVYKYSPSTTWTNGYSTVFGAGAVYLEDTIIQNNLADEGGGVLTVDIDSFNTSNSSILQNNGSTVHGGGLHVAASTSSNTTVSSQQTDWGVGPSDNAPVDIVVEYNGSTCRLLINSLADFYCSSSSTYQNQSCGTEYCYP